MDKYKTTEPVPEVIQKVDEDYGGLPSYYTCIGEWPESTKLICWHCAQSFNTRPYFLPLQINNSSLPRSESTTEIYVEGCFCHISCVGAYMEWYFKDDIDRALGKWTAIEILKGLYYEWTGKLLADIPIADPPQIRKVFCGNKGISDEEYNRSNEEKVKMYLVQRHR